MKVDLHVHSTISDGSHSLEELIRLAKQESVTHIALTNHDTTNGLREWQELGKQHGLRAIPGIEISAYDFDRQRRVHILGYWIDPEDVGLQQLCAPMVRERHRLSEQMVHTLIRHGYDITWEQVERFAQGGTGVYKQHIMLALMEKGYANRIYGELYKTLFARGNELQPPGIAYLPMTYVDAVTAVRAVVAAGGVPVLAHPGQYGSFPIVGDLVVAGLAGIEVWHPAHDAVLEETARKYAEQFDLVMTGGTDFHGAYGEQELALGSKNPGVSAVEQLWAVKQRGRADVSDSSTAAKSAAQP